MTCRPHLKPSSAIIQALLLICLSVHWSIQAQICEPPPSGLFAWWPGEGTAEDIQGTNEGALTGGTTFAAGKVGSAFNFNGSSYVEVPDSPALNPTSGITIEAWINPSQINNSGHNVIVSKTAGTRTAWYLALLNGGIRLFLNAEPYGSAFLVADTAPGILSLNAATHVAATFDAGTQVVTIYMNGVALPTRRLDGSGLVPVLATLPTPVRIGIGTPKVSQPDPDSFKGTIDELSLYNRALTDVEIQRIFTAGNQGKCAPIAEAGCLPPPAGCLAWWSGDGSAMDRAGTHNGALMNGAAFTTGKVGQAFSFDGVNDYVLVPDNDTLRPPSISVEGWFRFPRAPVNSGGTDNEFILASKYINAAGWNLRLSKDLRPSFRVYAQPASASANAASAGQLEINAWVHLAGTYDGTEARIFVNGAEQGSAQLPGGYTPSSDAMTIGTASWYAGEFLAGLVDELSLYDRALSGAEIQAIYTAGSAGKCPTRPASGVVVAWGRNTEGQRAVPPGLFGVKAIAAGAAFTLALKVDGTVVAWGSNDQGQMNVPPDLSGVIAVAAGDAHTVALKSDGTVVAWGRNNEGQAQVSGQLLDVTAIAAAQNFSVALKRDGSVVVWGQNNHGQRSVPGDLGQATAIAAGGAHVLAVRIDGTVKAWGYNGFGETDVPSGLAGVAAVAAGTDHSLALKNDRTVSAWGFDGHGEATVPPGLSGVIAIAANGYHSVALRADGSVVAWGSNDDGQARVPSSLGRVMSIGAGVYHTVAIVGEPLTSPAESVQGSITVLPGTNVTFSAVAHGVSPNLPNPLTFQWLRNNEPVTNSAALVGATSSVLTLFNVQPEDTGAYSVRFTTDSGPQVSMALVLTVFVGDNDRDGLPDSWERAFGLVPLDARDAATHPAGDRLTFLQKYLYGLNPLTVDTDLDSLSDYDELFERGTDPRKRDSDGDGMPDGWEVTNGLNPRINDGAEDLDRDGLTNSQEYQLWTSNQVQRPDKVDSLGDDRSDYEQFTGGQTNRFYYDKNDRLVGAEYSAGIAIAYTYDGNDNLRRQTVLSRTNETDRLPVLWRFLNGLTNHSSAFVDTDGDLWTDYQEWKAGTDPRSATSIPALLSNPGSNIASLTLPFIPTNFVVGVGQLDGLGPEEIVIGGDGDPGTNTNFLLVLTHGPTSWSTQRVDVGRFGITSIAVGQPTNRPSAGIYVGLRGTNGTSQVMEFTGSGASWQSNVVAVSTNEPALVGGIRQAGDLLANLATNGLAGALWSLTFSNAAWNAALVSTNASHRGIPSHGMVFSHSARDSTLRLLDSGEVEVVAGDTEFFKDEILLPRGLVQNLATGKWHLTTPTEMTWSGASNYFATFHGRIALPTNEVENAWLSSFQSQEAWIGLFWRRDSLSKPPNPYFFDGTPAPRLGTAPHYAGYAFWRSQQPDFPFVPGFTALNYRDPRKWGIRGGDTTLFGLGEIPPPVLMLSNRWLIQAPPSTGTIVWPGYQLQAGRSRAGFGTESSVLHCFVDDRNASGQVDPGDLFVFAKYLVSNNTVTTDMLTEIPVGSGILAPSYGVASVDYLNSSADQIFTAEPNGGIYIWPASNASAQLQRQKFSEDYLGKGWHALAGVGLAVRGGGLAGLMVDPASANVCNVIFWAPQLPSEGPALAAFETAPAAVVLPGTNALGSVAEIGIRLWDAEGNASTPFLQFQGAGDTNWQNATLIKVDRQPYADGLRVAALPEGTNHTITWNAAAVFGQNTTTNVLLRARAADLTLTGEWSVGTPFQVVTTVNPDSDGDGLLDEWERTHFGNLNQNGSDDFDSDGFSNLAEYCAGTDPRLAESNLTLRITLESDGQLRFEWSGQPIVTLYLEQSSPLESNGTWNLVEKIEPTKPVNVVTRQAEGIEAYFRLRLGD